MTELPPFLERCNKFPRSLEEQEDDWCSPSCRRCHRVLGRAYQVSVSLEALLEKDDASDLLLDFLDASYQCDSGEDQGGNENETENEDGRYNINHKSKIIWISDDVFITPNIDSTVRLLEECLDHSTDKLYVISFHFHLGGLCIVHQPSTAAEQRAPIDADTQSSRRVDVMDVPLRLLARSENVDNLRTTAKIKPNNDDGDDAQFPASHEALKAFVSEPQSERTISLQAAGLSMEQWHVVCSNSNENVAIEVDYSKEGFSLPETAIIHHCPANLDLNGFDKGSPDRRQMVLTALESTTFLKELHISFEDWDKQTFLLTMNTISRNRSITGLSLYLCDKSGPVDYLTLEEWELIVCPTFASHPTLEEVDVSLDQWYNRVFVRSSEKDEILIKMVRQNKLLVEFDMEGVLEDKQKFDSAVKPILEYNRFRQVVQAIKKEADTEYRQQMFTATLFSDQVCQHPDYRYLLFKENFDLLKQSSSMIEGILLSDWEMTVRELMSLEKRKESLETRMRDRGVAIPKSLWEDEDEMHMLHHRKKSKWSRSS